MIRMRHGMMVVALAAACSKNEAPVATPPFSLAIAVTSDPGHPVTGARVMMKSKSLGTTDATGMVRVDLVGSEGDTAALAIQCPDGFQSPERPLIASLRRLAPGSPAPRFEARCTPLLRTTVVGLRAENGNNLPVLYLGREVARTDASGVAHFLMQLKPSEQVVLTVGTSEKGAEQLRPQNPGLTFVAKDQDDLVLLEQKFTALPRRVYVQPAPKPLPL